MAVLAVAMYGSACSDDDDGGAPVTAVKGSACGYYVNVGLFGGPQNIRGCGEAAGVPSTATSPSVALPPGGSDAAITGTNPAGAVAQYGPARIFAGRWPEHAPSAPPSGPINVSTQGTPARKSVNSSVDIVLRNPANRDSPGGFGPGPVEGDELHSTCSATEGGVTGSVRFVGGLLATSTDAEGSPVDQEPIPENPEPNYTRSGVITNVGDTFTVVFNQQVASPDGSLTVNAVHMYLFGPTAVGELVIGQVTCGTTPSKLATNDTVPPSCSALTVVPRGPEDPTPAVPRKELIGVFDAGGLKSIDNVQVTNGSVQQGDPAGMPYLRFASGQTGPLAVTATRTGAAEAAGLPLTWSFDVTDAAGNKKRCP